MNHGTFTQSQPLALGHAHPGQEARLRAELSGQEGVGCRPVTLETLARADRCPPRVDAFSPLSSALKSHSTTKPHLETSETKKFILQHCC